MKTKNTKLKLQLLTIVEIMINPQNSAGFFSTEAISIESLIPGVPNFDFASGEQFHFSDFELGIPERLMIGKRAERYFSVWLKRSSAFELVAENIQVIDNKQTLGEFDFIVRRVSDQQLIHVELVYKFYLFDPSAVGSEFEHWIGPNRGDQLDFKLDKLQDHQFPLLLSREASDTLKSLDLNTTEMEQQVLFLANLFLPANGQANFEKVNQKAVCGRWMNVSDWEHAFDRTSTFIIPDKIHWFSKKLTTHDWCSREEAKERILALHSQKRSPLVYSKDAKGYQRRDFVVWW